MKSLQFINISKKKADADNSVCLHILITYHLQGEGDGSLLLWFFSLLPHSKLWVLHFLFYYFLFPCYLIYLSYLRLIP
jgi:hypothetical protein